MNDFLLACFGVGVAILLCVILPAIALYFLDRSRPREVPPPLPPQERRPAHTTRARCLHRLEHLIMRRRVIDVELQLFIQRWERRSPYLIAIGAQESAELETALGEVIIAMHATSWPRHMGPHLRHNVLKIPLADFDLFLARFELRGNVDKPAAT